MSGNYWHNSIIAGSAQPFRFDDEFNLAQNDATGVSDHYPVEFRLKVGSSPMPEAISAAPKSSDISYQSIVPLLSVIYNFFQNHLDILV